MKNKFSPQTKSLVAALMACSSLLWMGCTNPTSEDDATPPAGGWDLQSGTDAVSDYGFQQGNLEFTGNPLDIAIVGNGMLILKSDDRYVYFRRPARIVFNADGYFTLGNNAFHLQGIPLWDATGDSTLVDIHLPFRKMMPARATTELQVGLNLHPDSYAKGSILHAQRFLNSATENSLLEAVSDSKGIELGMKSGDVLTFSMDRNGSTVEASFKVTESSTMQHVIAALTDFLKPEGAKVDLITSSQDSDLRGAITIYGNTSRIVFLQVTSSRPISSPKITKAFALPSMIPAGSTRMEVTTDLFRKPAEESDLLSELYDTNGNRLGLEDGDEISIQGTIGGTPANNVVPIVFSSRTSPTIIKDLLDGIKNNFRLPERDGTPYNNLSVCVNAPGTDDNIPDGSIVLRGMPGSENALGSVVINATNSNNSSPSPNNFNASMNATMLRNATDPQEPILVANVFDSRGVAYAWTVKFTPTNRYEEWLWEIHSNAGQGRWSGNRGALAFGTDGNLKSWTVEDQSPTVRYEPTPGGEIISVRVQFGKTASSMGITEFHLQGADSKSIQNGYATGYLTDTNIDELGRVQGTFSNGETRDLYQIALADFPNEHGLTRVGTNSFIESKASGSPYIATLLGREIGSLSTGYLENAPVTTAQRAP